MKKVLITGGAGFIGANFVYKFLELGYAVAVFEKKGGDLWRIKKVKNKIKLYYPDLTDSKKTEKIISKIKPDIVLHFAAYGAYPRFQQDVKITIDTNLTGAINLVNACHKANVKCFINTGSSSEYGAKQKPMKETDALEADTMYGITKGAFALYCQMMARKLDFPVATARPFAVYGYFEDKERLIPAVITSYLENSAPTLSRPDSVRDFIFIEDLIEGYLSIIKNIQKVKGEIFNFGIGKQSTINDVVAATQKITGSPVQPIYGKVPMAQNEPKTWLADISKAKMIDWKPKHTLEEGLTKTTGWFKKNISLYN